MNNENFLPIITVIVPCRNEDKFIGKCLKMISGQDYRGDMEVLVVDGMSTDGTREIVKKYKIQNTRYEIRLLDNPKKFTPFALNIGIKESKGEIIIRMDAHAGYEKDYVSKCVKYLKKYNADNIGGTMKTLPADNSLTAKAIALCLSCFFGAASSFRLGLKEPKETDTVFGGCFNKEIFKKIGLFNENLVRSEDMEFNLRLKKTGGKIIFHPEIVSYYYPKSDLTDFFFHNIKDGIWAIYPLKFVRIPLKLRHYLPFFFVSFVFLFLVFGFFFFWARFLFNLVFSSYLFLNLFFSLKIALKEKDLRLFFVMPLAFGARHFGYGIGSLIGLMKLLFNRVNGTKKAKGN